MKFSIMGDSISTYEGYNPQMYKVFYTKEKATQAGLLNVNDTWWMKVIKHFNGELCVNDSYSGSYIAGTLSASAHSDERVSKLKTKETAPDIVLVCMGANDCGGKITLHGENPDDEYVFDSSYAIMLNRIKKLLPNAKVYCATIMLTDEEASGKDEFRLGYIEKYNDVIRQVTKEKGCFLIETFDKHIGYTTIDGLHPDKEGHQLIANIVISEINKIGL